MRLVLDTCVLFPRVMREMLLGAAEAGFFTPLWSPRILEEWRGAMIRHGPLAVLQAEADAALVQARFPKSSITAMLPDLAALWLPDPDDIHVLATAVAAGADAIITLNAKDFPRGTLREEGLARHDPDSLLMGFWAADSTTISALAERLWAEAAAAGEASGDVRSFLRKAGLPRLGRAYLRAQLA